MQGWSVANYVAFGVLALFLVASLVSGIVNAIVRPHDSELRDTLDDFLWAVSTPIEAIASRYQQSIDASVRDGNEPLLRRPVGLLLQEKRRSVIGATFALFAVVFALVLAVGQGDGQVLLLYGLPVFVVALSWGAVAGLAAAGIAGALAALGGAIDEATASAAAYVGLGIVFVLVGGLAGLFRDKPLATWLGAPIRDRYRQPRTPPEEHDPDDPWWKQPAGWLLEGRRGTVTALVAFLLAGISWLALAANDASEVPLLYTLPVALAAVLFGVYAGLTAAVLAAVLGAVAGTVGGAPISDAGYAAYAGLFAVVAYFNGHFRDKPLRVLPLYTVLLPIGLGIFVFNSLLGSLGSLNSAPDYAPPSSPQVVMVQQADASQNREAASLTDAVSSALAGDLLAPYQLSDVEQEEEGRHRAVLAELDRYVSEANARQDETARAASELESAVRAGDIRASTVVAVVDAYDNPAHAIRGLHDAYLSQFMRVAQEADALEPVADGVEAIFEERIKRWKEKRELEAQRVQKGLLL